MIGKTNTGGGGFAYGMIVVNYPAGSALTIQRISGTGGNPTKKDIITTGDTYTRIYYPKSAGKYRITATKGTNTSSQDVTISSWGQSVTITLAYIGYFYWLGDMFTSVTGGYSAIVISGSSGTFTNDTTNQYMAFVSGSSGNERYAASENAVLLTPYSKLYISARCSSNQAKRIGIASDRTSNSFVSGYVQSISSGSSFQTYEFDISNVTGSYYIKFSNASTGTGDSRTIINKIWAE